MTDLLRNPWPLTALLGAAALLVLAVTQAARTIGRHVRQRRKPDGRPRSIERILLTAIVVIGAALAPLFFAVMFFTVTALLDPSPSFNGTAWVVPAATEGAFTLLYLLDLYLQLRHKPMGWLRWAPFPFLAASLLLNVWSSWGDIPALVGHAVVTVAFFLPLIVAEAAVRSLAVSETEVRRREEMGAAVRYARDLVRDEIGPWWRWSRKVPSLLRIQIRNGTPPAAVLAAVRDGAASDGATQWERPVEDWITAALTQKAKIAVTVATRHRQIEASASVTPPREAPSPEPSPAKPDGLTVDRQALRQPTADERRQKADEVRRLLTGSTKLTVQEIAERAAVSKSTVERLKREMASVTQLHRDRAAEG